MSTRKSGGAGSHHSSNKGGSHASVHDEYKEPLLDTNQEQYITAEGEHQTTYQNEEVYREEPQ